MNAIGINVAGFFIAFACIVTVCVMSFCVWAYWTYKPEDETHPTKRHQIVYKTGGVLTALCCIVGASVALWAIGRAIMAGVGG